VRASERVEIRSADSDRVDDPDVGQFAPFAQPIDRRRADPQPFGYISHAQQPIAPAMKRHQVRGRGRCRHLRRRPCREPAPDLG